MGDTMDLAYGFSRHRDLSMKKVENGIVIESSLLRRWTDNEGRERSTRDRLNHVFYTLEEAQDFVREYFEAPSEDLQKGEGE